jgi:hypothetical protein
VLDEDSTLSYFFPDSPSLLKIRVAKHKKSKENVIGKVLEKSEVLENYISSSDRLSRTEETILGICGLLHQIDEVFKELWDREVQGEDENDIKVELIKIKERIEPITKSMPELSEEEIGAVVKRLEEFYTGESEDEDPGIIDYIIAFIFFHGLDWQQTSGGRYVLLLVSDASRPRIHMDGMDDYRQILAIGHTQAELFSKEVGDPLVMEIEQFKYRNNFAVISVKKFQRLDIARNVAELDGDGCRHPFMILTGSKKEQVKLLDKIGDKAHPSREGGETDQEWFYRCGFANVFYSNSVISRGLDLPQYNVLVSMGGDFSIPYWTAAIHNREEELKELDREASLLIAGSNSTLSGECRKMIVQGLDEARAIKNSLIRDEFTNSCLRIAPTQGSDETRPKVLICSEDDLWKLEYLDDQILKLEDKSRIFTTESIVRLLREDNLTGYATESGEVVTEIDPAYQMGVSAGTLTELISSKLAIREIPKSPFLIRQERIEEALRMNGPMTAKELALDLLDTPKNIRRSLVSLKNKVARNKIGHQYYWYLADCENASRIALEELKEREDERRASRRLEIRERVLNVLRPGRWMTISEMRAAGLKGNDKEIRDVVQELVDAGLLLNNVEGRSKKYNYNLERSQMSLFDLGLFEDSTLIKEMCP